MIEHKDNTLILETNNTSCILEILPSGQIELLYYGKKIKIYDSLPLKAKITAGIGCTVSYPQDDPFFSLDLIPLSWSGSGKGDFRHSPIELVMPDGSFVSDFVYIGCEIIKGNIFPENLPSSYGDVDDCSTLVIKTKDNLFDIELYHYWTVYEKIDVISRRCELSNNSGSEIKIRKLMSYMMDLQGGPWELTTFDGGWIKETHVHKRPINYGMNVNDSTTGGSSHRHNPGFIVSETGCRQDTGLCFGFNLVYSGNHYSVCELSNHDLLRVMGGINPHNFEWPLSSGESFASPEAYFSFSNYGFNGLSANMHDFINNHIVRGKYKNQERPVLMNNWEATFFDFNESKILKMAREAKKIGVELIVLDDGWFGARDDDTAGLGDYDVNKKKLPGGLKHLAKKVNDLGMEFGLWFEPEMVNEDSSLYREHPDWAIKVPGREPSRGRNQLVLNLTKEEVRDYIVENVNGILSSANITYVKWDMNRHMTDVYSDSVANQGMVFHSFILGLYDVLGRIIEANPNVLFESCSSGGNRFDPGMLCFMPQVWASDDTDPGERLKIQEGLSYLYPLSTMGAHVSSSPHQQTLRKTRLSTRCNVSAFGL
ncbi:MAG: alpha-galactosidase, partial [Spirochaetales bacterium]|nr:alpha-galactosidase [Spirochaetales bacterium]